MVGDSLIQRIDFLIVVVAFWSLLSLVLSSYARMAVDPVAGVLSLATVVLVAVVDGFSFVRNRRGS